MFRRSPSPLYVHSSERLGLIHQLSRTIFTSVVSRGTSTALRKFESLANETVAESLFKASQNKPFLVSSVV